MKKSVNLFVALLLVTLTGLTACGIKPGSVAAPQGEEKDTFPAEYPNPSTFSRPDRR